MKNDNGFRPYGSKEAALQQAETEELEGTSRPLSPVFTPEQKEMLKFLDGELEAIRTDLMADPLKARGYAAELRQILLDIQLLPHNESYDLFGRELEKELSRAIEAAEKWDSEQALAELISAIKSTHAFVRSL